MENFISTTTWKHLKTSPTHIRLHTRKTCVFWMKSIADKSFSLLFLGKVDASLCEYCENVSCICRFFLQHLVLGNHTYSLGKQPSFFASTPAGSEEGRLFLQAIILREVTFFSFIEKLFSVSGATLSFIFCNVRSSYRARGALG